MIYITGDTHGGIDMQKLTRKELKRLHISLSEEDIVIITGDFGFPFAPDDIKEYENGAKSEYTTYMKWFAERPYKVLFVDGNHDNHDWWSRQPVTQMYGGRVQIHPHAQNVIHLMRGEIYEIESRSFFTFGGAASVDKKYRTEGYSWWSGEEPTYAETELALENLERAGWQVDYIITHTLPQSIITQIPRFANKIWPCRTARFLDTVLDKVKFDKWFCGHFHIDMVVPERRMAALYNTVHSINEFDIILSGEKSIFSVRGR